MNQSLSMFVAAVIDCHQPPDLLHATAHYDVTTLGSTATYSCNVGYRFASYDSDVEVNCTTDGSWQSVSNQCVGKKRMRTPKTTCTEYSLRTQIC